MDIIQNAKIPKGQGLVVPVFHIAVLKNATSILGVGLVEDNRFSSVLKIHVQRTVWQEW